ncbi:MAG: FtsX-like permease family protein [Bacteroidales bacterium]|nr:FtsX-like permease family protein [Bacteroidales bacterium]
MSTSGSFIASKLRFKGRLAVISIAVSFFVIVLSLAISSGFRKEIRGGVSKLTGDIQLTSPSANDYGSDICINADPSFMEEIGRRKGIEAVTPVIYRAGILQNGEDLQGVLFKAVPSNDSIPLQISIPRSLARTLRLSEGDQLRGYFIGERVQVRKFTVSSIYEGITDNSGSPVVMASYEDIRRINGWDEGKASALEITLSDRFRERAAEKIKAVELAGFAYGRAEDEDDPTLAVAAVDKYYNLFDWLDLIDFNVLVILLLMVLVAGFNMISGLLIFLFRNIPTIGTLKALGMGDRGIAGVFMRVSARVVLKGMLLGNALALLFCLVQGLTHFIRLNPDNYFISYVPVSVNWVQILAVDVVAFGAIMLLLLIPSLFIARVDPADTVRVK